MSAASRLWSTRRERDYSIYRGATVITPNRQELADATHAPARTDEDITNAAAQLRDAVSAKAVLVTRSEAGMTLVSENASSIFRLTRCASETFPAPVIRSWRFFQRCWQ